ncbi:MAG: hypothetical protein FWC91_04185 [Defluviitaleaceae bacterium]|nr:hypothetical protein [Defluviitaleaceae bacterium]
MKKIRLKMLLIFAGIFVACSYFYYNEVPANEVVAHIEANYMDSRGIVLNYKDATTPQYLSESIGLYMQYLLEIRDMDRFREQVDLLLKHFAVEVNDYLFIKWELGERTTVGALIDDLRIAWILNKASQTFDEPFYLQLADRIITTIKSTMIVDNRMVDFFDWHYSIAKNQLFMSYYIVEAMELYDFPDYVYEPLEALTADPFFKEVYINGELFVADEQEVNMIDQSLIATAYFRRKNQVEPNFQQFLEDCLLKDGLIFARYNRNTLERTSDNQSSATYAFLLYYLEITNQLEYYAAVRKLLEAMQTYDPVTTHFFDFINRELAIV